MDNIVAQILSEDTTKTPIIDRIKFIAIVTAYLLPHLYIAFIYYTK